MTDTVEERVHAVPAEEVARLFGTDPARGLERRDVEARQQRHGPNQLSERRGKSSFLRFLEQFQQPLVYILLGAAAITGAFGEWVDSGVILGVVLVNAIVGFMQEARALNAIAALSRTLTSTATVLRDGARRTIAAAELVPGDLVLLQSGDRVPADMRLLRSRELQVDESALTGESLPVHKDTSVMPSSASLGECRNMAYSSTLVTYGAGTGLVVAIGDSTEIGRISEMIASAELLETPLTRKISAFSRILLVAILILAAGTFAVGLLRGEDAFGTFMAVVALAVGAIPEGLPAAVTIMLAIGVSRMASRRAVIRRLPAVETLGSTTVVCSDKTGTLTRNEMTVQQIAVRDGLFQVEGTGYEPVGRILLGETVTDVGHVPALRETLLAGALCNDSVLREEDGRWRIEGDPTEAALLVSARKAGLHEETLACTFPRLDAVPFESQYQYMATLHDAVGDRSRVVYVKGAVEALLPRCSRYFGGGSVTSDDVHTQASAMGSQGLRVLAFARKTLPGDRATVEHEDLASDLELLGLQGMIDPPRPEAMHAVKVCLDAGVSVKMITGDHPATARAIAERLGIGGEAGRAKAVTGAELANLSDEALIERAETTDVFARVSPEHKLRLVEALQAKGHVVAMTGDGVNDAPALRRADIGVAMGLGGTEVAREAADMILTDDNFATIEAAIEEGRGVFDNLVKFIVWTLPTNGGEAATIMVAIVAGFALPVLPVQILWINMTTAVCLGMMLAFEPKEPGIMSRRPRAPGEAILTVPILFRVGLVSMLLGAGAFGIHEWELQVGASSAEARTAAVSVFVFGEMFYLFNCRSLEHSMFALGVFSNHWIWVGAGIQLVLQLVFTYVPAMNTLFHTAPLRPTAWAGVLGVALLIYLTVGLEKWLRFGRTRPPTWKPRSQHVGA